MARTTLGKHASLATAIIAVSFVCAAPAARAQLWLDPADPARSALGPAKAAGAVIWSHGRSVMSEDSDAPTPPYMGALRDGGWDTFRFNRRRASDTLGDSSAALAEIVHRLKLKGYRRVALAGQSFGAFVSLMAAASDEVDAVIATAPAAYGSFSDFYDSWRSNATALYPLLERVRRARVMLFYFHGDDFDPGGRGAESRDILAARQLDFAVIDQPPRLVTHWAAGTPLFGQLYSRCILGFLEAGHAAAQAGCPGEALWAASGLDNATHTVARN
jgi:dienelactone hydrolase